MERKLSAILSVDVKDYSQLMGEDEVVYQWNQDPQTQEQLFVLGQKAVALDESQPVAHETLGLAYLGKKRRRQHGANFAP